MIRVSRPAGGAEDGYRIYINDPAARLGGRQVLMVGVDYGWDRIDVGGIARANRLLIEHWNKGGLVTVCMHPGNPCVADGTVHGVDGTDLGRS